MNSEQHFVVPRMGRVRRIHFVGIAGAGMCGIAEVLHDEGYQISGSDLSNSAVTERLMSLGITVYHQHHASQVQGVDVVVRSTAIIDDNPELVAARQQRIPVIPRAMMLAELMRFRHGIAISGTHGKTTTTSLVTSILKEGGLDPSFVIGGKLTSCGTNAQHGKSAYFVAEADESDASFLFLKPTMAVVTNIDADHMETYAGSFDQLRATFVEFLHHLPFYGLAVVCIDNTEVRHILPLIQRPTVTYGFSDDAHYRAADWTQQGLLSTFTVHRPAPYPPLCIQMDWPGRHNAQNALAAIAIATELKVTDEAIISGLRTFQGVGRRFQVLGQHQFTAGSALIVDDYGHHPQEIRATLDAVHAVWPDKRLIHVFQPHRYSRTQALFPQFVDVLTTADELLLLDIYPAGEAPVAGVSSTHLLQAIQAAGQTASLVNEHTLAMRLNAIVQPGDVVLFQGAGSISQMGHQLLQQANEKNV